LKEEVIHDWAYSCIPPSKGTLDFSIDDIFSFDWSRSCSQLRRLPVKSEFDQSLISPEHESNKPVCCFRVPLPSSNRINEFLTSLSRSVLDPLTNDDTDMTVFARSISSKKAGPSSWKSKKFGPSLKSKTSSIYFFSDISNRLVDSFVEEVCSCAPSLSPLYSGYLLNSQDGDTLGVYSFTASLHLGRKSGQPKKDAISNSVLAQDEDDDEDQDNVKSCGAMSEKVPPFCTNPHTEMWGLGCISILVGECKWPVHNKHNTVSDSDTATNSNSDSDSGNPSSSSSSTSSFIGSIWFFPEPSQRNLHRFRRIYKSINGEELIATSEYISDLSSLDPYLRGGVSFLYVIQRIGSAVIVAPNSLYFVLHSHGTAFISRNIMTPTCLLNILQEVSFMYESADSAMAESKEAYDRWWNKMVVQVDANTSQRLIPDLQWNLETNNPFQHLRFLIQRLLDDPNKQNLYFQYTKVTIMDFYNRLSSLLHAIKPTLTSRLQHQTCQLQVDDLINKINLLNPIVIDD
jgi:hypothetical protein